MPKDPGLRVTTLDAKRAVSLIKEKHRPLRKFASLATRTRGSLLIRRPGDHDAPVGVAWASAYTLDTATLRCRC